MPRVTGIGGVFFKSRDPRALAAWYRDRLGFAVQEWGGALFHWREGDEPVPGYTVWSPFSEDTSYFAPSQQRFMLNLRVDDLDGMLDRLRASGDRVLDRREVGENGRFGYVLDPDGTLIELWEPSPDDPSLSRSLPS